MKKTLHLSSSRQSGIELLKIIAMVLICISHSVQSLESFVDFQVPTTSWMLIIFRMLRFFGNIGNLIFIICSSYFLIGSKGAKKEKALNLLLDSQIIAVGIFLSFITVATLLKSQFHFSLGETLNNLFPDLFETVWFVPCYVIFYLAHPAFNTVINSITQKQHFVFLLFIFIFYGLCGLINCRPAYSSLLGFVFVYFVVAYLKRYCTLFIHNRKKNVCIFFGSVFFFLFTVVIKNYLSLKISYFEEYPNITELTSIVFLPMIISLFNIFLSFRFSSKFINYLASCSLFFYCIHENLIIRSEIRPMYYSKMIEKFGEQYIPYYLVALIILLLVAGFTAAAVYKQTFSKLTKPLSSKIVKLAGRVVDILFNKMPASESIKEEDLVEKKV